MKKTIYAFNGRTYKTYSGVIRAVNRMIALCSDVLEETSETRNTIYFDTKKGTYMVSIIEI